MDSDLGERSRSGIESKIHLSLEVRVGLDLKE